MIAVVDYGMGNLGSVINALNALQADARLTTDVSDLQEASGIILPGVGAFGEGMENLRNMGFIEVLEEEVLQKKKPYLGICLGLQFLAKKGLEHGEKEGLGWIKGIVKTMEPNDPNIKIPHMGWNNIEIKKESKIFEGLQDDPVFYFVHSFAIYPEERDIITSVCDHGGEVVASIQKDNIFATQFHPEKSQSAGLKVLKNFINFCSLSC
jgi:imidazole glycerol-phosphate synthase subunit HisH